MKTFQRAVSATIVAAAFALSASSHASEARARDRADVPTRTVSAADLDLANPRDVETLYARLQYAAQAVCRESAQREFAMSRTRNFGWRLQCYRSAVDRAIEGVDDQRLTALHRGEPRVIAGLL
jgi:UrcA family protein